MLAGQSSMNVMPFNMMRQSQVMHSLFVTHNSERFPTLQDSPEIPCVHFLSLRAEGQM